MRRIIWLSVFAAVVLVAGGCKQLEPTLPAPQPAPTVVVQQDQTAKEQQPLPVVTKEVVVPETAVLAITPPPEAAVIAAPPAPEKAAPVETKKAIPTATVKPKPTPTATPSAPVVKSAATPPAAPKTVTFTASNGNVTFDHLRHSGNNACSSCHPSKTPVKILLDKDKAHQLCKGCHQQKGSGPTQCTGCHKKG